MSVHRFVCVDCGQEKIHVDSLTTGYGIDKQGRQGLLLLLREARFGRYVGNRAARFST